MKRLFLLSILLCTSLMQALAYQWTDTNGVTWTFYKQTFTYADAQHEHWTITGVTNNGDELTIPETVYNGETPCTIEAIGSSAFYRKSLSLVNLPSTVKYIGNRAFCNCTPLTKINLKKNIVIGTYAFSNCTTLNEIGTLEGADIGSNAFSGCSELQSVDVSKVVSLGAYAFNNCKRLKTVGDLSGFTTINEGVFYGDSIQNVNLANVTSIGASAFYGCKLLESIGETTKLTEIGSNAFYNCTQLQKVNLPNVTTIGNQAFYQCSSLESIGETTKLTDIAYRAFYNCTQLQKVNLSNVTTLGNQAFYQCSSLESIGETTELTEIGSSAFINCTKLQKVNLSNVTTIGGQAFYQCSSLESIGETTKLTEIPIYTFYNCTQLQKVNLSNVTTIGEQAFYQCSSLESIGETTKLTEIGNYTFYNCTQLQKVNLSNVTTIGERAFYKCSSLESIGETTKLTEIASQTFRDCTKLQKVNLSNVTTIGGSAFYNCSSLESLTLPKVKTIGGSAFSGCNSLNAPEITSTALSSVGSSAFTAPGTITIMATTPATIENNAFGTLTVIRVPDDAVATYRAAEGWSDIKSRILGLGAQLTFDVNVKVQADRSGLSAAIGESNLGQVVSLKITGGINSYDIMVMRNKMDNLHYLDLTDANIVANSYEYITGHHTENDVLGAYSFASLAKLATVKLPTSIKSIGSGAFSSCTNLREVEFQAGLQTIGSSAFSGCKNLSVFESQAGLQTIGSNAFSNCSSLKSVVIKEGGKSIESEAFQNCSSLKSVVIKEGVTSIGSGAFWSCSKLESVSLPKGLKSIGSSAFYQNSSVTEIILPDGLESIGSEAFIYNYNLQRVSFPSTLKSIGSSAFYSCSQLTSISLPTSLEAIQSSTFSGCSSLTEVRIPSTIKSIGNTAFSGCSKLNDVYTYIAEPTPINMNTFSTYTTATLHVPSTSYYAYWYDTEWSQFRSVVEFDADYEYFYINRDFLINDEKGTIQGEGENDPDADLNPGSGLIVETEQEKQELNEVHIKVNGDQIGSIIADANVTANKVYYDITITGGKWYFLSFPFRVQLANVEAPGNYVFRYYNGATRATGKTGWTNWLETFLTPGQGYIFQCNKGGTLTLCVEKADMNWVAENRPQTLTQNEADNEQDASWNYLGNPHHSYFDIDQTGFTHPITVWTGSTYEAVRPGDDDYRLRPFEAFFVQKPDNESEINFPAGDSNDGRFTYLQWETVKQNKAAARRAKGVSVDRQIVNLAISDGENTDKTRVVFNEKTSLKYEKDCDASKFLSSEKVPQLYTMNQTAEKYAINERPTGEVRLAYVAPKGGELTISAVRMDQPMMLRDNLLQITFDLTQGDYTFSTEAGTYEDRFMLVMNGNTTGVGKLRQETGVSVMAESNGINFSGIEGQQVSIYSIGGAVMAEHVSNGFVQLPKAAYIVKVDEQTTKLMVK